MPKLSFAGIIQLGDSAIQLFDRDAADLLKFGIGANDRATIKTKTDLLRHFKTDEELLGLQTQATADKDSMRTKVLKQISDIMLRVKLVYTINSPIYNSFGTKEMHAEDDANVVRIAYRVHRLATENLQNLSARGLTQIELDDFMTQIIDLDNAIDKKEQAVRNRNTSTQARNKLSEEVYRLVADLYSIGKQVYEGIDEARYNDYLLYDGFKAAKPDDVINP